MLAVSYARWSSAGQTGNTSLARQSAAPAAYCAARGWTLWEGDQYQDPGVSAFAGDNVEAGDLGRFLADHRAGRFGGQPVALLLEDVDRFSRSFPLSILPVLVDDVLNAGITLSLMAYSREYSRASIKANPIELHELLMRLSAAHEFSERLSRRVTFAHDRRRQAIRAGQPIAPGHAPSWLELTPAGWQFTPYASVVRRVIALAHSHGCTSIARILNSEGVQSPGAIMQARQKLRKSPRVMPWTYGSVEQLLNSPQLHGARPIRTPGHSTRLREWKEATAQLRRQGVPEAQWPARPRQTWDPPQEGYFPALITPADHDALLALMAHRRPPAAGRTDQQRWIGATLTFCTCGEAMGATGTTTRRLNRSYRYIYLRCRGVGRGGPCSSPMLPLKHAQAHLLVRLTSEDFAVMLRREAGEDRAQVLAAALQQQQAAEVAVANLARQQAAGDAALAQETDPAVVAVLARRQAALEQQARAAATDLQDARHAVTQAAATPSLAAMGAEAQQEIRATLSRFAAAADTVDDRRMVWRHLRRLGLRITIDAAGRRMALQVGDGQPTWQPVDPGLAAAALAAGATGATFFGSADEVGAGVEWPE